MPDEMTPADPLSAMDAMTTVTATLAGMRQQLIDDGWPAALAMQIAADAWHHATHQNTPPETTP